jgi:methylenetetrahydrofolate--tRNA-(uracil-5-)-methyltransferase
MLKEINVIGAGLAGSEAAFQLATRGYKINLFDGKAKRKNDIQKTDSFAELVCSNTFRSLSTRNAVGILKKEMQMFNSIVMKAAFANRVDADDALAVDRDLFAKAITNELMQMPNIHFQPSDITKIDFKIPTIIATGPLTTSTLLDEIVAYFGQDNFYYLDASSPILEKDSLDLSYFHYASRHKNDNSYLCYPMDEATFDRFHAELINAKTTAIHDIDKEIYFKGCQPIEVMAKESKKILLNGPMSPNNFEFDGVKPYAVLQLRKDDANDQFYNIVGFQTNIKWPEQKRVLQTLAGFENVKIYRYGVLHKNNYINSAKVLNGTLQARAYPNIFFAGQITGVEGYIESAASGIIAALGMADYLERRPSFLNFPDTTVMGSLVNYVTNKKHKDLKPMKANIGLLPTISGTFASRDEKNDAVYERSMADLERFIAKWGLKTPDFGVATSK